MKKDFERLDILGLAGLIGAGLGFILGISVCAWQHAHFLDSRTLTGLIVWRGQQYEIIPVPVKPIPSKKLHLFIQEN